MRIIMNSGGLAMTNCYVIADEDAKQAAMFDAPNDTTAPLLDEAQRQGWELVGLWLTHGHFDHVADHAGVTARFPRARVLIHRLDAAKLRDTRDPFFGVPLVIPNREPDGLLEDGQSLTIGSLRFEVLHTPGHCAGHVAYYCAGEKLLVGGDLIIMGAVGRTDLPDSRQELLEASIRRVMRLPGETRLLPGHGQVSTLDDERESNPYVKEALAGL